MLGLRRLERSDALDDVHRQLLRVLDDVRGIATALRPPALGQLGLVPALQGLGLTVHAHGVPEPARSTVLPGSDSIAS
jgi:signal transduction histidine kinase